MFDTMTMTKVLGGLCGSLLVYLLGAFAAESLYHVGGDDHGDHGEVVQGYMIEVASAEGADEEVEEEVDFGEMMANAEASAGEKVWAKCRACHKLDGSDGTGPHLNGVVGRAIAGVDGFGYSDTLAGMSDTTWSIENLNGFLEAPKDWAPGTKMAFVGLNKPEDRADLITYLESTAE